MATAALKTKLTEEMKVAMKNKEKERLGTIRLALSALKQIEVDERIELDDARIIAVLDKLIKQRRESIKQYESAGRDDLAANEASEIAILQTFLPEPLSEAELNTLIQSAIEISSASSMKDMGSVMAILKPQLQGRADMGAVSKKIKEMLS